MAKYQEHTCQVCGKKFPAKNLLRANIVRPSVVKIIEKNHPGWIPDGFICENDLNHFRSEYVYSLVEEEKGELSNLEKEVVDSIAHHEILATQIEQEYEANLTFGQKLSDKLARFGGSWTFILCFASFLFAWVIINSLVLLKKPFDPYPYILLNLFLSCLAALQAPIIMMSQKRQEEKDRARSTHDYQVNLKAELEVRHLHEKIDHLLSKQWERLVNIQEIQLELMAEIGRKK